MAILSPQEKNKFVLSTFLLLFTLISCEPKHVFNIDEVFSLKPSYSISSKKILDCLKDYNAKDLHDEYDDTFVIHVTKSNDSLFKVSVAKVDFPTFRKEVSKFEYFKQLRGYSKFGKDLVLLYWDADNSFFTKLSSPEDIMYNEFKGKRATNYEPHFIDYYLQE